MHATVNIALRAARTTAEEIARSGERLDRVTIINADSGRFLTSADQDADNSVLYQLRKTYPDHGYQSRVSGNSGDPDSGTQWLIDPLAGNRNFARGLRDYAISIACRVDGQVAHAVVIYPFSREEFTASRGAGAQCNGRRIRVDSATPFDQALLGIEPQGLPQEHYLAMQAGLLAAGVSPRTTGCGALNMVQVAAGRLQGGWGVTEPAPTQAAARLLLAESGGLAAGPDGSPDPQADGEQFYGGTKTLKQLLQIRRGLLA